MLVLSAFSPKMFDGETIVKFKPATLEEVRENARELNPVGIGHPGAAELLSQVLQRPVDVDRTPVKLQKGDKGFIILANGRLEPGTELTAEELKRFSTIYYFEIL